MPRIESLRHKRRPTTIGTDGEIDLSFSVSLTVYPYHYRYQKMILDIKIILLVKPHFGIGDYSWMPGKYHHKLERRKEKLM